MKKSKQRRVDTTGPLHVRAFDITSWSPISVNGLIADINEDMSQGHAIPFFAVVFFPETVLNVSFVNYDPDQHKPHVTAHLINLIRKGANRILIVSEVWFLGNDLSREWHGVMVQDSTPLTSVGHFAPFEGRKLGEWKSGKTKGGNYSDLFEKAWMVPGSSSSVDQ